MTLVNTDNIIDEYIEGNDPEESDLAFYAIMMSARRRSGISIDKYFSELKNIYKDIENEHSKFLEQGNDDNVKSRLDILRSVICEKYGFDGEEKDSHVDIMIKADMIEVMERKSGSPVALAIIYISAAEYMGWEIAGITIPEHFVLRLQEGGGRLIFDPSDSCKILQAHDLRSFVKEALGEEAELSHEYYEPPEHCYILKRLQNHIKYRQIDFADYSGALNTVSDLIKMDPDDYSFYLDAGVLNAKIGNKNEAIKYLKQYIDMAPISEERQDALIILRHIETDP